MLPIKPYLLRAAYEWALDSGFTPHLLVKATAHGVVVPNDYIEDGRIVLNVHPDATNNLLIGDESVEFSARFSGRPFAVKIPLPAILGLYARENGEGISFPADDTSAQESEDGEDQLDSDAQSKTTPRGKPDLKIIK
jgi:stringent starvation protein B